VMAHRRERGQQIGGSAGGSLFVHGLILDSMVGTVSVKYSFQLLEDRSRTGAKLRPMIAAGVLAYRKPSYCYRRLSSR
jgi:hypothetical protein